jgi:hypothetical protein
VSANDDFTVRMRADELTNVVHDSGRLYPEAIIFTTTAP